MPYTLEKGGLLLLENPLVTPKLGDSENLWTLNFGPQHPATHTVIRLVMEIDGILFPPRWMHGVFGNTTRGLIGRV